MELITVSLFKERLAMLLVRGGAGGWPRDPVDERVLLKSAVFPFEPDRIYNEAQINIQLEQWLEQIGTTLFVDHVKLRRYLVDAGYLRRDRAGRAYRVNGAKVTEGFEAGIDSLDPSAIVESAREQAERRKQAYLAENIEEKDNEVNETE